MTPIDWTPFDKYTENTVDCHCGAAYRSHTKAVIDSGSVRIASRRPCPKCGKTDNVRRASSDIEEVVIGKDGK